MTGGSCARTPVAAVFAALVTAGARAQLSPTAPFLGAHREGFEGLPLVFSTPQLECFNGYGTASAIGGWQGIGVSFSAGGTGGNVLPHAGVRYMDSSTEVVVKWLFEQPAKRSGGYFATWYICPNATAEFYDDKGNLMATQPVQAPNGGSWQWNGWKAAGEGFTRVYLIPSPPCRWQMGGGTLAFDDLELDFDFCYADCDGSGGLTISDFACFQATFALGSLDADCNGDLALTIADFGCFQGHFAAGCP